MASSFHSSTIVNQEEFNVFHNIDRQLFSRIVFNLNREPAEAMHVSALWLWLERLNTAHYIPTLLRFPDNVFEAVYKETMLCLKVVESSDSSDILYVNDVPLVRTIVGRFGNGVTLEFFRDNRFYVLLGVSNIIQQVCLRAFQDLIQMLMNFREHLKYYQEYMSQSPPPTPAVGVIGRSKPRVGGGGGVSTGVGVGVGVGSGAGVGVGVGVGSGTGTGRVNAVGSGRVDGLRLVSQSPLPPVYEQNYREVGRYVVENPNPNHNHSQIIQVGDFRVPLRSGHFNLINNEYVQGSSSSHPNNTYVTQPQVNPYGLEAPLPPPPPPTHGIQRDLVEIIAQMRASETCMPHMGEERLNTLPSERTIFLTFSKGYPIYENELRDFLNRSFGDVVEALFMQEVSDDEQPLYARLVVRDLRAMELILSKQGRSKFSINGKHVWARKYVRKNPSSPPSSPSGMTK